MHECAICQHWQTLVYMYKTKDCICQNKTHIYYKELQTLTYILIW